MRIWFYSLLHLSSGSNKVVSISASPEKSAVVQKISVSARPEGSLIIHAVVSLCWLISLAFKVFSRELEVHKEKFLQNAS